nr:PREDICTED: uncharacterized protein LOC105663526 [Megachile rotundata]
MRNLMASKTIRKKTLSGKGKLTGKLIDQLTIYYGLAIRRNCDSIQNLKSAIWTTHFHYNFTDKNLQHNKCPNSPDSWCTWQRASVTNTHSSFKHDYDPLPSDVSAAIKPIYEELSKEKLLEHCIGGFTQNNNESLNQLIWKITSKILPAGSEIVEIAEFVAADRRCAAGITFLVVPDSAMSYDAIIGEDILGHEKLYIKKVHREKRLLHYPTERSAGAKEPVGGATWSRIYPLKSVSPMGLCCSSMNRWLQRIINSVARSCMQYRKTRKRENKILNENRQKNIAAGFTMPKGITKKQMKRKVISLESKIKILDRLHNGERVIDVAKFYSMNEATIRTIRKNEDSIRKSVAAGSSTSMSTTTYIYEKIKNQLPSTSSAEKNVSFSASHGWFERFKRRHSLHNLRLKGEQASADSDAAQQYPAKFAEIIAVNSYIPDQVFNADESGLFWKKMPERTYLAKAHKSASGHKAAKSRITVLFCCNASGDHVMKPLVINKSKTPRSFKGIKINNLPVYWMANKKAWVTATLFNEWFHNFFVPDVKRYLSKKGLPFKALLLIDNAPGHPQDLHHENVQVVFLPKNTTSLLQPLDQGIISTFKAQYIKRTFRYILEQMENDEWKCINDMARRHHSKADSN